MKMQNGKRFILILATLLFVATMFSGCSKSNKETEKIILVIVEYEKKSSSNFSVAYGYIYDAEFAEFEEGTLKEDLKVYNVYIPGKYEIIPAQKISSIEKSDNINIRFF